MAIRINIKGYLTKAGTRVKPFVRLAKAKVKTQAKTPRPLPASGKVKLRTKKPRRSYEVPNSYEYAKVLKAERQLPKGIKVEMGRAAIHDGGWYHGQPRVPKNRRYTPPEGVVYSHGTEVDLLKKIKKSGHLKVSEVGLDGPGLYLAKSPANENVFGEGVFEFPGAKVEARHPKIGKKKGDTLLDQPLPISEASKFVLLKGDRADFIDSYYKKKRANLRIRYKKQIKNLINFSRQLR
jgi:hypothetical protein